MGIKTPRKLIKECDDQLDTLYTHFGKFIYENIERENIYYCFDSENGHLEEEAKVLLKRVEYSPGFEKKEGVAAEEPGCVKREKVISRTQSKSPKKRNS